MDHALNSPQETARIGYPWATTIGTMTEPQERSDTKGCYRDNQQGEQTQKEEADVTADAC
jgi:hypothetical protein